MAIQPKTPLKKIRAVKRVEKRCKSAQMSTKCWSIILKFGQKILGILLNLTAQVLQLHLV